MARTYVITGDPMYKHYFTEIYDIREGKRPRPLNYSPAYWHLVAAGKAPAFEPGEAVSLLEMFRRAGFNEEEYCPAARSPGEFEALGRTGKTGICGGGRFQDDGTGNFTVRAKPDRELAIQHAVRQAHTSAIKLTSWQPIQKFMDLYNVRMQNELNRKLARLERQSIFEMALIFIALLATMGILFYTRLGILQPLAELGRQVAGLTRGIRPSRYGRATSNEVAKLSEALALADAEKRQLLENERIARTEAERASQLKDEFLATLSHELRTPLNAILGWSQLILSGNMKKEDIHKGLETIERNARAQNKLIEDLLEMSSIISGKGEAGYATAWMSPVWLMQQLSQSMPTAQAKGIVLTKNIDPQAGPISGRLQPAPADLLEPAFQLDKIYAEGR